MKFTSYTRRRCAQVIEMINIVEAQCVLPYGDKISMALPEKPCYERQNRSFRDLIGMGLAEYCARRRASEAIKSLTKAQLDNMTKTEPYYGIPRFKSFVLAHLGSFENLQTRIDAQDILYNYLVCAQKHTLDDTYAAIALLGLDCDAAAATRVHAKLNGD